MAKKTQRSSKKAARRSSGRKRPSAPRLTPGQKAKARKEVARKLGALREEAGLSQAAVAGKVRMSASLVSKIERGERALDPLELARFARLYGKSIVDFTNPPKQ